MNIGDRLTIKISSLAYGGEGIAKHNGLTGFIHGALPEELIKLQVTEIKGNYFRGRLLEIMEPSPFRVAPPCPYFGKCGGCCYQHLSSEKQMEYKAIQLQELLKHIGKITNIQEPFIIPSPKTLNYRNQITLKVKSGKLGFTGIDNRTFVPIEKCFIVKEEINNKISEIRKDLEKNAGVNPAPRAKARDFTGDGVNGKIVIKCDTNGNIDCAFLESISDKAEYKLLQEKIENKIYFSLATFFQTNPYILPFMLGKIKAMLRLSPETVLFDLYCGTGLFSISLSEFVKTACGIETNHSSVKLARKSALENNIKNCLFFEGAVEEKILDIYKKYKGKENIFIIDPPRQGLSKDFIKSLNIVYPDQLLYISCEPAKLARDIKSLNQIGFALKNIGIADMFPQTKYFETFLILSI